MFPVLFMPIFFHSRFWSAWLENIKKRTALWWIWELRNAVNPVFLSYLFNIYISKPQFSSSLILRTYTRTASNYIWWSHFLNFCYGQRHRLSKAISSTVCLKLTLFPLLKSITEIRFFNWTNWRKNPDKPYFHFSFSWQLVDAWKVKTYYIQKCFGERKD